MLGFFCVGGGGRPAHTHTHIYTSTQALKTSSWRRTFSHTFPALVGMNHMQDFSRHATSSNKPESVLSISHAGRLETSPSHARCAIDKWCLYPCCYMQAC